MIVEGFLPTVILLSIQARPCKSTGHNYYNKQKQGTHYRNDTDLVTLVSLEKPQQIRSNAFATDQQKTKKTHCYSSLFTVPKLTACCPVAVYNPLPRKGRQPAEIPQLV